MSNENECIECGRIYEPHWDLHTCDACMATFWHNNPHPLDVAEAEFRQDQCPSLEDLYDMGY